jgi:hypothetical protein
MFTRNVGNQEREQFATQAKAMEATDHLARTLTVEEKSNRQPLIPS